METKVFEIRDRMTFIPVMVTRLRPENDAERFLIGKAGFGIKPSTQENHFAITKMNTMGCTCDETDLSGGRTMLEAFRYIKKEWNSLMSGDVIDVEFILGESTEPKQSEHQPDHTRIERGNGIANQVAAKYEWTCPECDWRNVSDSVIDKSAVCIECRKRILIDHPNFGIARRQH